MVANTWSILECHGYVDMPCRLGSSKLEAGRRPVALGLGAFCLGQVGGLYVGFTRMQIEGVAIYL